MIGKSLDTAVVIDIKEGNYVHAEYVWLDDNIGEYEFIKQELIYENDKYYDKITIMVIKDNEPIVEDYYFVCTIGFNYFLDNFDKE